ncbi:hypothetical protein MPTK1_4g15600 [Marchantia polymorpha subsp. ruderalis]|uniref:Uncharacterized protein n=2 Tax=Marchantia polymorpha TaxID=3197 RepID=A0AAF6BA90_MARPO|nr:hypothetical protein MARPO_0054s0025 [Marchantia polymorpha]BBN08924.1 hypothetical protein Mp_4g15600 [Marchantia polymorpha subsp. ruderalis]|eukprot:PTQ37910.1 hypothetical protein MARPO_0054s0025 [Marchantia polymorpha]
MYSPWTHILDVISPEHIREGQAKSLRGRVADLGTILEGRRLLPGWMDGWCICVAQLYTQGIHINISMSLILAWQRPCSGSRLLVCCTYFTARVSLAISGEKGAGGETTEGRVEQCSSSDQI